ncbi:C40 family peptidase [Acidovorax sp. Be4]|uniref:C40 family peptidase n=1 Tax=Acidovorax bellezanensis TaxID=2976702 RepID=A0ABT2PIG0_9BURK|nr:C40 family peptidase [Acidovorax sp. Be4]MCT9810266.1 C40 family peptidase [Acidovorax sp. Be4]
MQTMPEPTAAPSRRLLLSAALAAAATLAGCSSAPARRSAGPCGTPSLAIDGGLRDALYARTMLVVNTPYTYGGNTPEGGFDCSGLVQYALQGITEQRLPRSTSQWATVSSTIDRGDLQRGDFVFFNTSGGRYSHMGIYVGGERFVHAPSSGGIVRVAAMDNPYFRKRFTEARTVFAG